MCKGNSSGELAGMYATLRQVLEDDKRTSQLLEENHSAVMKLYDEKHLSASSVVKDHQDNLKKRFKEFDDVYTILANR